MYITVGTLDQYQMNENQYQEKLHVLTSYETDFILENIPDW